MEQVSIKRKVIASLIIPIFLFSCAPKYHLVEDFALSSFEANYGRAESNLCGHYAVGDNICWIQNEDELGQASLEIKTYLDGIVYVRSDCGYERSFNYLNNESVLVDISEVFDLRGPGDFCVIDYLVTPYFPDGDKNLQKVEPFSGRSLVFYLGATKYLANIKGSEPAEKSLFYEGSGLLSLRQGNVFNSHSGFFVENMDDREGAIRLAGCESPGQEIAFSSREKYIFIPISSFVGSEVNHCTLYGETLSNGSDFRYAFVVSVEIFDDNYIGLAEPSIKVQDGYVFYENIDSVNWTIINNMDSRFLGSGKIKLDDTKMVFLTSGGRSKVIKLKNGKKQWTR